MTKPASAPPAELMERARLEGRYSASVGSNDCPYMFIRMGCDQETFDRAYRPLLDAWWAGYMAWRDEHKGAAK